MSLLEFARGPGSAPGGDDVQAASKATNSNTSVLQTRNKLSSPTVRRNSDLRHYAQLKYHAVQ